MTRPHGPVDAVKRRMSDAVEHRRPFWAREEKSHQIYINKHYRHNRASGAHHDQDTFSFDPDHLHHWELPLHLIEDVPRVLLEKTADWQQAGAAVCTALDRARRSYHDARHFAYPGEPRTCISRHPPAIAGAETPSDNFPATPITPLSAAPTQVLASEKSTSRPSFQHAGVPQAVGMESPPLTPLDSDSGWGTPPHPPDDGDKPVDTRPHALPDLDALHSQLHPLSIRPTSPTPTPHPEFNQQSWEHYLGRFQNEMHDAKLALGRFKGYGTSITILILELTSYLAQPEAKMAVIEFSKWFESMQPRIREYEERVNALELPRLAHVTIELDMDMARQLGHTHSGVLESSEP